MAGVGGAESARMRLAEPLAALSLITDLALGKPTETAIRACILAACLAERLGLSATDRRDVYYATLLRSIGCTSTSHEIAWLFGDDIEANRKAWRSRARGDSMPALAARQLIDLAGRDIPLVDRLRLFSMLAAQAKSLGVTAVTPHCEVGARMAERVRARRRGAAVDAGSWGVLGRVGISSSPPRGCARASDAGGNPRPNRGRRTRGRRK